MQTISEKLNPNMSTRKSFGLKAESTLHRITLNPLSANPGETLYLYIPKLSENKVIVPRSVSLRFDLILEGHANNTVVNNVIRKILFHNSKLSLQVKHFKIQQGMICLRRMKIYSQIVIIN